jgi:acyl-CoA reductase-like NAD-dependent aldehyde dehydrogenase
MSQAQLSRGLFIDGDWHSPPGSSELLDVYQPETGELLAQLAVATAQEIDEAVESAEAGFREWSSFAPMAKERVLAEIARGIEDERESLAEMEQANTGKRMDVALEEIDAAAELFTFYAGFPSKSLGDQIPISDRRTLCYTLPEPIGVVAAVTPWNYPLVIIAGKVAAALAAGCSVVAKPAPETPLTALELARIAHERGLPRGALNVIAGGADAGRALVGHPRIGKVSFTGSTDSGRDVLVTAGANGRPATLELGGKSPNIVFADIDVTTCLDSILMGALTNAGQECCAGARMLVEAPIFQEFVSLAGARVERMRVGSDEEAEVGPLISRRQHDRVAGFVERAVAEGASVAAVAEAPSEGFFYPPTMLVDVHAEMEACREEIFGPVITVDSFENDDQALMMANATHYGLAAGVWTSDIDRSIRFARELESGLVWVNSYLAGDSAAPFGGSKDSGFGRELGLEGPKEFMQTKTVYLSGPPQ